MSRVLRLRRLPASLSELRLRCVPQSMGGVHRRKVEYSDLDAMNHVNNSTYFKFFETVRVRNFSWVAQEDFQFVAKGFAPVLSDTWCSFHRPISMYDHLHIGLCIEDVRPEVGQFNHRYLVWSEAHGRVAAQGGATVVMCDFDNGGRRAPLPDWWVARIDLMMSQARATDGDEARKADK